MIALDPNELCPVSLKTDEDKPEADRPAFLVHYMTARQSITYETALKDAEAEADRGKQLELLDGALKLAVTGWRNVPREFPPASFLDVLSASEMWEIVFAIPNTIILSEEKKRKRHLPADSDGASSAPAAPVESATTPPPPTTPS